MSEPAASVLASSRVASFGNGILAYYQMHSHASPSFMCMGSAPGFCVANAEKALFASHRHDLHLPAAERALSAVRRPLDIIGVLTTLSHTVCWRPRRVFTSGRYRKTQERV